MLVAGSYSSLAQQANSAAAGVTPNTAPTVSLGPLTQIAQAITSGVNTNAPSSSGLSSNPGQNAQPPLIRPGFSTTGSGEPTTGLFPGFGATLIDDGIDIHGVFLDHFYANPSAGVVTGELNNLAVFSPAVDLDLDKIIGLPGGFIHAIFRFYTFKADIPQIITNTGGILAGAQATPASITDLLSELTYEQRLFSDKLSLEAGRTNVYNYFFIPNSLDPFTSFSTALQVDGNQPLVPYPVWGGRATYHFTPDWYAQTGAFEDNFIRATKNGNNFGLDNADGAEVLAELDYRSEFSTAAYPANLEAGAEWNTRHGPNNLKGTAAAYNAREDGFDYVGGGVLYLQGLQTIWRGPDRAGSPPENVAVYGSVDTSVDKPQPIDLDAIVGTNITGFIPSRPLDAVGLQIHYQRLSALEAAHETATEDFFAGKGPSQRRDGFDFEGVGNIQLTSWAALRPSIQYVLDPDEYYDAAQRRRAHSGWIGAAFAVISFGRLLGTSTKPF